MHERKDVNLQERRQVVLGLTGLLGVIVTGCSFGNTNVPTLQGATPTTLQAAITPTPTIAPGTTLYVYRKHTRQINDIAWSPDSKYIISASNGAFSQVSQGTAAQVYIWNARTGEANAQFASNQYSYTPAPLVWSPDGKMIALCEFPDQAGNNEIGFLDAQTGKFLGTYQTRNFFNQLAWSPDSSRLAVAGGNDVEICDASTRKKVLSYPVSLPPGTSQPSKVVAWSPDGTTIASAAAKEGHSLQFWNASTGEPLHYFIGSKPDVAAWSPDGKMIAIGNTNKAPQILDVNTGKVLLTCQTNLVSFGTLSFLAAYPHSISWSPDSKYIAVANNQNQVQIWGIAQQNLVYTYTKHTASISAVAWSPDGSSIASASYDKTVHVWQAS